MKRFIITILIFLMSGNVWAATYYVDSVGGNNSNVGTSADAAWQNFTKLNAVTFAAGDTILFKRGCTWAGKWSILGNGTSGNYITVDAYGTGAMPIWSNSGDYSLQATAKSYWSFNNLWVTNSSGFYATSSSLALKITNCIFYKNNTNAVYADSTAYWIIDKCTFLSNGRSGVRSGSSNQTTLKNSIVVGNCHSFDGIGGIQGAVTYSYCAIGGNGRRTSYDVLSATDGGNNQLNVDPKFKVLPYPSSFVQLHIDDFDVAFVKSIADTLTTPAKFTAFLIPATHTGDVTNIQYIYNKGHEIGVHSYNHNDLSLNTLFTVTSTNTLPTINIDPVGKSITLSCSESGNIVTVSWSSTDKTIADLKTAVSGKGWTITTTTYIQDTTWLSSLASSSGTQSVGTYAAVVDLNTHLNNEIARAINWMTTNLGFAPTSGSYPHYGTSAAIQSWIIANTSLLGYRGGDETAGGYLSSITVQNSPLTRSNAASDIKASGTTQAIIEASGYHDAIFAKYAGKPLTTLIHTSSDLTAQQAAWYLDAVYTKSGNTATHSQMLTYVRGGSTSDNNIYTHTYSTPDLAPTEITLKTTGEGGTYIGAIDVYVPPITKPKSGQFCLGFDFGF